MSYDDLPIKDWICIFADCSSEDYERALVKGRDQSEVFMKFSKWLESKNLHILVNSLTLFELNELEIID
jgi:elongation factor P hydroxylase